ncbi:MAG: hypothetical protein WAX05_04270, partial [Candidatus Microthrix parvicella]
MQFRKPRSKSWRAWAGTLDDLVRCRDMLTASMVKLSSLTDEPEALNNDISHRVIAVLKDERLGS